MVILSAFYIVNVAADWQNEWDKSLSVFCPIGNAINGVKSTHSSYYEDRRFEFSCETVFNLKKRFYDECGWTGDLNNYEEPFSFTCPPNYVMTGVKSIHHDYYEDRKWDFTCCIANGYTTKDCHWTNYVNDWDGDFNIEPSNYFLAGAESYHNSYYE